MSSSRVEEKRKPDEDEEDEEEDHYDEEGSGSGDANKRSMTPSLAGKRRSSTAAGAGGFSGWESAICQADNCTENMAEEKRYHRRHKVREYHAKATVAVVAGIQQRFCQQCSRFHEVAEFDQAKRSCRRRLMGHNERRRKGSYDFQGEGSS